MIGNLVRMNYERIGYDTAAIVLARRYWQSPVVKLIGIIALKTAIHATALR